jgi:uncharacterized phosphosugar-binding protein
MKHPQDIDVRAYSRFALPHLEKILTTNLKVLEKVSDRIVKDVQKKRSLFVFGSGHSAIFPLEVYHRAGGPSFVIPLIADFFLPSAGPSVVRLMERTPGSSQFLLERASPRSGEMVWLASQSGINSASVDLALEAKRRKLYTVAFTSTVHSKAVNSRHPSGKKLYQVCDEVVDLGGAVGDASVHLKSGVAVGPLSSLGSIFLAHSILTDAMARLEQIGIRCVYTSVNTPQGEGRNQELEKQAKVRDMLLR